MYSTWWRPKGQEATMSTDHDALHRDEQTHMSIQSDEAKLRPLDLETIMSSKASVKYWYLHRPKTMALVHQHAVKIQSIGRSFATRRLIEKYGLQYTVELAKKAADKREVARLAQMTEEEKKEDQEEERKLEERRLERKRIKREINDMEVEEAISNEGNVLWEIERKEEELHREEKKKALILQQQRIREEEEIALAAAEQEKRELEAEKSVAMTEPQGMIEERESITAKDDSLEEDSDSLATAEALGRAQAIAQRAAGEAEAARCAKVDAEQRILIEEAYENSLGINVPVVTPYGNGKILSYNKESGVYAVEVNDTERDPTVEDSQSVAYLQHAELELDDSRILSPRTVVDTPFGLGEVVGLDPHAGCYAVNKERDSNGVAYIQIPNVKKHEEAEGQVILDENHIELEVPQEIGISSTRIVDSRVVSRTGKRFVQYKLEIQTTNYGTLFCWKRYSTFRKLCERLVKEKGFKKKDIPMLPKRHIIGNFSQKTIGERAVALNEFLDAAVKAEHLQWGIQVDEKISVYKRRVKRGKN